MLSEAVQLMGMVAQGGQGAAVLQRPSPAERAKSRVAATQSLTPKPLAEAPALPAPSPEASAPDGEALRGRLQIAPTASEEEFKAALEAAAGAQTVAAAAPAEGDEGWTWKELLTTLDGEASGDDAKLGEALFDEISDMSIDPNALLPKGRIEEIAAAIQTGDALGGREVVRTLAPAAIRRIGRRLFSDTAFRSRAQALVRRYAEIVGEAVSQDKQGFRLAALLASNAGRAYLLLDAAGQTA
jgi:hypothetical protein